MNQSLLAKLEDYKEKIGRFHRSATEGCKDLISLGELLEEVFHTKLYKQETSTFEDWCQQNWGWTANYVGRLRRAARFMEGQKLLADTGQDVPIPKSEREARRISQKCARAQSVIEVESSVQKNLSSMSAKVDPECPVHYATPVPAPAPAPAPVCALQPATVPISVANKLDLIIREAKRLTESGPAEFKGQAFQHLVRELQILRNGMQMEFPTIMAQVPVAKPRSRCTIEEAKAFCKTIGLPEDDGEWFFWKMDGAGWKNSGVAVASWQGTIQAWKRAGYMCSQTAAARAHRNGGPEKPKHWASKEIDRELELQRRGK